MRSDAKLILRLFTVGIVALMAGCAPKANEIQKLTADQPIRVEARVDRAVAAVGDRILFTVQAMACKGVDVFLPADLEVPAGLEMKDAQTPLPKKIGPDQTLYRREWMLSPEKVGAYIFKPLEISYQSQGAKESKTLKTATVYLDVRSVLKEGDLEGDIRDIKGPAVLPSPFWIVLAVAGGAVVLTLLGMVGYRYWKNRGPSVPPLLPHEWALVQLENLVNSGLLEAGKFKEFAERLSGIFRSYVEKRFGLMAPERTTEEFIVEMRGRTEFEAEQQGLLGKFLAFCDMIKFAEYAPTQAEMSEGVKIVRDFVEQTKPVPVADQEKAEMKGA